MGYELATPRQAIAHCSVWRLTDGERQHFPKHALLLSSIPRVFIYNFSFQYTRWGAISPEGCVPVLMLRTDCSFFALRYAHSSRLLPPCPFDDPLADTHARAMAWCARHGSGAKHGTGSGRMHRRRAPRGHEAFCGAAATPQRRCPVA